LPTRAVCVFLVKPISILPVLVTAVPEQAMLLSRLVLF
jgi:hypothetical protein